MIEGNSTKRSWIKKVFANDSNPIIPIDDELAAMSGRIFEMLIQNGLRQSLNTEELDYVAASGIATIISLACSAQHVPIQPVSQALPTSNAAQRTTELFLLLLEEQFPVDYPNKALQLKSAADYANRLSVHVNHLNRVVKSVSGKTTSELIAARICTEAIRMLQQSALSISEVAFALGFEEPASFSAFIRRHTGSSPSSYRRTIV